MVSGIHKDPDYNKKWIINHPDYHREWNRTHKEECVRHARSYQKRHPEQKVKFDKNWRKKHPEIIKIENLAQNFPLGLCCTFCGSTENLQRAHFSYLRPEFFITLCPKHHKQFDKEPD